MKSSVWSSIKMHISTVTSNSIWIIGSGENINLWSDNWLGELLLDLLHIDASIHDLFSGTVADVIENGNWNFQGALLPHVTSLLDTVVLPTSTLSDVLLWTHTTDGKMTAKHAKSFMTPATPELLWPALIWLCCTPPSHSFIFWRLFHGKMPTDENLRARGCVIVYICNLCMQSEETFVHLFLLCPFAVELWSWIGGKLNCLIDLTYVVSLLDCVPVRCSTQITDIFVAAVVHTLHIIWLSRNSLRFSSNVVSMHAAKVRLQAAISLSGNLSAGHCLILDAPILDAFSIPPHHRRFKDIITVFWKAPSPPWKKVNTDGTVVGN